MPLHNLYSPNSCEIHYLIGPKNPRSITDSLRTQPTRRIYLAHRWCDNMPQAAENDALYNSGIINQSRIQAMGDARNASVIGKSRRVLMAAALSLLALVATDNALACASCGCTLSTDWGSQGVSTTPGFTADLSYSYIDQNTLMYGSSKASSALINTLYANGQEIETSTRTQTVTVAFNYNSDTWAVGVQVPYLYRTHATDGTIPGALGANYATSSDNGIGDMRVIGRYSGFSVDRTSGLIAGIKLPTGSTSANFNGGAGPLDSGLQLGSGSTDIILGAYTSGLISTYGWFVQGTMQHAISPLVDEATGTYRPGNAYSLNAGIRYAGFGAKVSPMLQLNIIRRDADEGSSINNDVLTGAPISGGTLAYVGPGASVRMGGGTSVYGFIQLPVYQDVSSLQLVPKYTLTVGMHQTF